MCLSQDPLVLKARKLCSIIRYEVNDTRTGACMFVLARTTSFMNNSSYYVVARIETM